MEIKRIRKRKQKNLAGLFLKFAVLFCVTTILIAVGCTAALIGSVYTGAALPANYAETQLTEHTRDIKGAGESVEEWIPQGCTYGIYSPSGEWKSGSFTEDEREEAWRQYQEESIYAPSGAYYRFIEQESGDVCIVQYGLYVRYAWEPLNGRLPSPEAMSLVLTAALFILNAVLLSRHFAKRLNQRLGELRKITDKIGDHDLEFETKPSDIKEIDEVMTSLSQMKDALKTSLETQWEMEQQKQEQLTALAHDIKTPLTVIQGNAELLAEDQLSPESKECADYILANVRDIEQYLEDMKQVLYGNGKEYRAEKISCAELGEELRRAAEQIAAADKIPVHYEAEELQGDLICCPERLLRAWKNILSNAGEYTDKSRGIWVRLGQCEREGKEYMTAAVQDYGPGFSPKDLEYADQEFYSGDDSRHNRKHQGLGLAIAKRFLEEQGGFLEFGNYENGAEVVMGIMLNVISIS